MARGRKPKEIKYKVTVSVIDAPPEELEKNRKEAERIVRERVIELRKQQGLLPEWYT